MINISISPSTPEANVSNVRRLMFSLLLPPFLYLSLSSELLLTWFVLFFDLLFFLFLFSKSHFHSEHGLVMLIFLFAVEMIYWQFFFCFWIVFDMYGVAAAVAAAAATIPRQWQRWRRHISTRLKMKSGLSTVFESR